MSGHGKSKAAASRASKKSRSVRAGIQFPVGRIHRIIRHGDLKQEVNNPGEQNPETHLTPAEIAAVKAQTLTKVKEGNFKHIASELDVNQPTLPHGLGSIFVTPPNILKQQLTGYCTSPVSSPMDVTTNTVGMKSMRNLWQSPQDLCHLSFLLVTCW